MKSWFYRALLILVAGMIFIIANVPASLVPFGSSRDIVNHGLAFAVLTFLVAAAFPSMRPIWVFAALLVFNTVIELSQRSLGFGRQAELRDWLAGAVATALMLSLMNLLRAVRKRWSEFTLQR